MMAEKAEENGRIFKKIPKGVQCHYYRACYAQAYYDKIARPLDDLSKKQKRRCLRQIGNVLYKHTARTFQNQCNCLTLSLHAKRSIKNKRSACFAGGTGGPRRIFQCVHTHRYILFQSYTNIYTDIAIHFYMYEFVYTFSYICSRIYEI